MINRLAVLVEPGRFDFINQSLPELKDGYVRVKVDYCGLCGTDVSYFRGERQVAYPKSLGHEISGSIALANGGSLEVGQGVVTDLNYRCGKCDQCEAKRSHLCRLGKIERFSNRGFARYIDIDPSYLYSVNDVRKPQLALAEPLSCGIHAVELTRVENVESVLVVGAGGMGMMVALALWLSHPTRDFKVVDRVRGRALSLEEAIPSAHLEEVPAEYGLVFETSGSVSGLRDACGYVRSGGALCIVSHYEGGEVDFLDKELARKEVKVIFSYQNGEQTNMLKAVDFLDKEWKTKMNALIYDAPITAIQESARDHVRKPANKIVFKVSSCL